MPIYSIQAPNGRVYDIEGPAGASEAQLISVLQQQLALTDAIPKKGGIAGAFGKGAESLGSSTLAGIQTLLGSPEAAVQGAAKREQGIQDRYAEEVSFDKVREAYDKQGVLAAGRELVSQIPKAIAEQAPNIAASMGSAAAGARLGALAGPYGAIAGGALGAFAPSFLPQVGGNIQRQAEAGQPLSVGRAAAAAVPQAALDVAANFIPFGRQVIGKVFGKEVSAMLEKGAAQGAEKLAQESLSKSLAKGTAVGALAEVPTEIAQQMLERAQAGLSLTSPDALTEYGQTAYQVGLLAPLGAIGRVSERAAARDIVASKQREKQAQDLAAQQSAQAAEAAKQAAYRQTPEYITDLEDRFAAAQTKYNELAQAAKAKVSKDDLAAVDAKKVATQAFNEYKNSKELRDIRAEYLKAQPQRAALAAQRTQQAEEGRLQELRQQPGFQAALPGMEEFSAVQPAPQPTEEERNAQAADYAQKQQEMSGLLEQHQQKESDAAAEGNIALLKSLREQREKLQAEYNEITKRLQDIGGYESPEQMRLRAQKVESELFNAQDQLKRLAGPGYDPVKADRLVARIEDLQKQLDEFGGVQRALPLGQPTREQVSEKAEEFALRRPQQFLPTEQAAAEEQAALEEGRAADEARLAEERRQQRVAPEEMALRRMAEPTLGERIARATAQPEEKVAGSPAMGRAAQELAGVKLGEGLLHTAEEGKAPAAAPVARRVPGEGFRLFNERGEPQRPSDYKNISQRLARALANPNLTDEAYAFLRRAEAALPQADYRAETARSAAVQRGQGALAERGTASDIAQTEGLLTLLDQQLAKIESGQEGLSSYATQRRVTYQGLPAKGGRAETAQPTMAELADIKRFASADPRDLTEQQRRMADAYNRFIEEGKTPGQAANYAYRSVVAQPEGAERTAVAGEEVSRQKRVSETTPETIRGKERFAPLSMQGELEPLVRDMEQAAQDTAGVQGELFPEEAKQRGAIKPDTEAFQRLARSPYVNKLRKQLREEKAAGVSPALKKAEEARARRAEQAVEQARSRKERDKAYLERQKQLEAMYGESGQGKQYDAITEAQRLARDPETQHKLRLTKEEQELLKNDPMQVLGGYRSRQTVLIRQIREAQKNSREAAIRGLDKLARTVDEARKVYKQAGADRREAMAQSLHRMEAEYDRRVENITQNPVVWPGMRKQVNELARVIETVDLIEQGIESGRFTQPEERVPAEAKVRESKEIKALRQQAEQKRQAKEAAARANAPTTSGEALTKSEVAKRVKPQKTVYSSKGVPLTPEEIQRRVNAARNAQRQQQESEEARDYAARIEEKLKNGKTLNPFEENFVMNRVKAAAVKKVKGTEGLEASSAQQDRMSDAAIEAVNDGRILDALEEVAKSSKLPFIRETADKLRGLVARTKLMVVDDVTLEDGTPVAAAYNSRENAVLMRPTAMTEATFVHEVVHAATMRALEGPESKLTPDQLAAKRELTAMFNRLSKDGTLSGEYAATNVKEFASEVQSNANLRNRMSEQKWFGSNMLKRALNAFLNLIGVRKADTTTKAAQDLIERLYMQSGKLAAPLAAAPQSSIIGYEPSKLQQLKDNMFGLAFRQQVVDRLAPADEAIVRAEGAGKLASTEAFNAQYFMRLADNTTQAAGQFITHGPVRIVSEETKDGREYRYESQQGANLVKMSEYLDSAAKESGLDAAEIERMATVMAAGQRAEALPNGWARLMSENPEAARAEYMNDKAFLDANPKVKGFIDSAIKEYKQYNDGLVDFAEQCDFLSKEEADRLKSLPYVPFYRVDDGKVKLFVERENPITIGNIADNPDLKQLLGDNKKILPILSSAVQNTFMLSRAAMKNKATLETTAALYKAGFVSKMGKQQGPANADTVHYKYKGKPAFATIDQDTFGIPAHMIVKGMEGIKTTIPAIVQAMGMPANMLRKFITRNPAYAVRQIVRDPVNAFMLSGVDGVPIVNALREMSKMKSGRSDAEESLMRGLAISSNVYSGNEQDMQMFLRDVAAGKSKWDKLMSAADTLALQADAATRAVIYRDSIAKGFSEAQAQFRAMESQNFSRRGLSPSMQMLSTMIPFFNAQIQGLDVLYRSLTGKMPFAQRLDIQRKIKARGLLLATGAMAYAMMMSDDEAYKKATPEERYGNFFVYLPGVEDPVKLPVPFEIGILFIGSAQALVDSALNDTKGAEAVKGMAKLLWQSAPGVVPAGLKPFLEAAYGTTMYGPIESAREKETLQAGERFRPETTEVAKQLGAITGEVGVSPLMLEHLTRGFTGSLGISALHMLDPLFGDVAEKTATPASKMPFVGGLFQTKDGRFLIDRAYDRMQEVAQAKGTFDDLMRRGERARAESFAQRFSGLLAQADMAGSFRQRMGKMFADERAIRANTEIPRAEKEALLKQIKEAENLEAQAFYAATERTTPQ